jgi:murein L,D-transpeptidase YafK
MIAIRKLAIAALLLFAIAGAGLLVVCRFGSDVEAASIEVQRLKHRALARLGLALPAAPESGNLNARFAARGLELGAPVFIRIFKREFELELWVKRANRFDLFAVYPICTWSGRLGPKLIEGDQQAPEGFYTVDAKALNPVSRWHRSFNLGFPNAYDRAHGRTGSFVMLHGGCSSLGCYAVTNAEIDELWHIVTSALRRGQSRVHLHVFPFHMTEENLASHAQSQWATFWRELKRGYELFEVSQLPPRITVCHGHYTATANGAVLNGSHAAETRCPEPVAARL